MVKTFQKPPFYVNGQGSNSKEDPCKNKAVSFNEENLNWQIDADMLSQPENKSALKTTNHFSVYVA